MLPKQQRYTLYVILLILLSVAGTTAIANSKVSTLFEEVSLVLEKAILVPQKNQPISENTSKADHTTKMIAPTMFTTIIQGADSEENCDDNGFTIARFNLCGDFDDRLISLSGGAYSSVSWQVLGGSCSPDINTECPNTGSCYTEVSDDPTFSLDASAIPSNVGAEYRVIADGQTYYFKVKKSTINQTYEKQDFICGVNGRIQITNLSSSYEYSIDDGSGFGAWQGAIFSDLAAGTYIVKARLRNTANTCEYLYEPIVIEERNIEITATFVDALCSGDTGSITVNASGVPGPYKYTLLNSSGVRQEFTAFLTDSSYTFPAVGFGTYIVQVETYQCAGDPGNGINPPRQDLDINGNTLTIGAGASPLDASTEVNSSFGCADISSVDITLNTNGGSAPYTFRVNGGSVQPAFGDANTDAGSTTFTVTAAGTYDFLITDSNGCTISASSDVETLSPPDVTVAGIDGSCSNGGAKLEFTINNGRGYNISFRESASAAWVSTPQISVAAGTYNDIEVRYQQGDFECTMAMPSVNVNTVGSLTGSAAKVSDVSCTSGGTIGGQIDFSGPFSGGSGSGYEFSIDGVHFSGITSYSDLSPGTYTPIIRDAGGCRLELTSIEILDVDPPTDLDFLQSNISCSAGTSDLQLTPTSNAAINRYEIISPSYFDNGNNDTFIGLLTSQAYVFQITDVNGCTYTEGFRPVEMSSIRAQVKSGGDLRVCNGATDGSGTFVIDGFANNYTYQINGGAMSAPQSDREVVLPLSGAGTYTITVTDVDTGCTDTVSFDIQEATVLDLSSSVVTPMSCDNNNIGRVEANVTGGWGGYRFSLEYPSGYNTGVVSSNIFGNLTETTDALDASDVYTLTAIDSEGCSTTFTFDLEARTAPSISIASADLCYSPTNDPSVTVTSSGGGTGHMYRINNGTFTASPTFNNLFPGTYTIEVQDDNDCSSSVTVTIPPQVNVQLSVIDEIPCAGNGTMGVDISGGNISDLTNTSYTVFKDGVAVASATGLQLPSGNFDFAVGSLEYGTYTVAVEDNNGCTDLSEPIVFEAPSTIAATHRAVGPSCGDANSGFIDITPDPTVGIPPYEIKFGPAGSLSYSVSDDGAYQYSSQTTYSGLPVGNYEYVVKDGRGCLLPGVVTVNVVADGTAAPNATVAPIDVTCVGNVVSGGIAVSNVSGGVPEFVYIVEDLFGNEITRVETDGSTVYPLNITHADIVQGDYQLITLDSRGCRDIDMVSIGNATVQIQPDNSLLPPTCTPGGFPYCLDIIGGTGPFDIRILDGTNPPFISLGGTPPSEVRRYCFPDIQFGEVFTVEVVDTSSGCTYQEVIEVPQGPSTVNVNLAIDNATCIPGNEVGLTYDVTGSTGLLDIEIRNTETGDLFIAETRSETNYTYQVPEGAYSILVFDNGTQCSDGTQVEALLNAPRVDILENINANCNAEGQLTVRGSGGAPFATGSPYEYAYVPTGTPVDENGTLTPGDSSDDFTDASTVTLPGAPGVGIEYDIWVRDSRNCSYRISAAIITEDPPLPAPGFLVSNQCDVTAAIFTIDLSLPAYIDTPSFTLGGVSQLGTRANDTDPWTTTFTVNSVGVYHVDVMDANGCVGAADPEVYQVLSASGEFTTPPNCTDANGVITVTANGGSSNFNFELQDSAGNYIADNDTGIFTGVPAGEYQVVLVDDLVNDGTIYCPFTVYDIISTIPTAPSIISDGASNISCNGANDGSINVILAAGSDTDGITEYNLYSGTLPLPSSPTPITTNPSGSFTGLSAGDYVAEVVTDLGCTDLVEVTISEPVVFAIEASAPDFACEPGANRYSSTIISITVLDPGTIGSGYQYSITGFSNYQSSDTFEIIDDGSEQDITVYAIDGNGCQTTFDVPTIFPPTDVVPQIIEIDPLNCRDDERVRIEVSGTTDFTVNTISVTPVAAVTNTAGINYVDVFISDAGDYLFEITDNTVGCTYPMPIHTVNQPEQPIVVISEAKPVSCAVPGNDGALFITVDNYVGEYDYTVYEASDLARSTPLGSGSFNTNDYPNANGEAIIDNLPGGNLIVDIVAVDMPFCSAVSNVTNIRTPNGPLEVSAVSIGNVSCTNNTGEIEATGTGGWDTNGYEYRLMFSTDGGATYAAEITPYSSNNSFTGLSYGFYRVEIRDSEMCTSTVEVELDEVPEIVAGIREPQGLDCPNGNNAVLETFDMTSGDVLTATSGASGGFAGAGYNYTLLYLNSSDNTDILSQSGLQNTPTFIGDSGGYISAGWYAIEVSSSFGCSYVTEAYYVDPPPPIQPLLVQTRVPGCGGDGQMRLTVENPDPSFSYEYLRVENDVVIGNYEPMNGTSVLISGVEGITYQFDVRKVNSAGACPSIRSNGITMTNATGITLLPNLPDDISCASELDGRIESFINGGVGEDLYYLFEGDPIDAFNPASTSTMVRGPQENGTFENLPEGTNYYIAVTSGATCMDIAGPFEIIRPEPIIFDAVPTHVTCNGQSDGSITVSVSEGGVGLIQFAIAPNFNEFFSDANTPGSYTFDELEAGTYEILIQDENGCFEKDFITIEEPDQIQIINIDTSAELCIGANNGSVSFDILGGTPIVDVLVNATPFFEYKIEMIDPVDESGTATFEPYLGDVIENLQGGASYAIYVQGANLCNTVEVFTVDIGVDLSAEPIVEYGCDGIFPTSTTTVNWMEGVAASQLMFALDPINPADPISANATDQFVWGDLPAGDHIVYIYHENGCTNSVEFTIDGYEPLTFAVDKIGPNEIVAVAEGGFGGYEYFFNGVSYGDETNYTTNESGIVNVRVVDDRGCELDLDVPFEFTGMLEFPNFFTPDGDNLNDIWSPNNRDLFAGVQVKIYDRYGRVVAILDEVSGWDGTYEGKEVPTGDYWYVVNANEQMIRYVGHFTLYR